MTEKNILDNLVTDLAKAEEKMRQEIQAGSKPLPTSVKHLYVDRETSPYRPSYYGGKCGDWVSIRVCDDETKKSRLGVYIGEIAVGVHAGLVKHDDGSHILECGLSMHSPSIFVPSLNRVVFGHESWWGKVEGPDKLREITDEVIDGVWYVQALKALGGQSNGAA